jgi:hypothetical protein
MDSRQSGALVRHLRQLVDPRAAAEPVQVRLAPCGSARVRFVDPAGQPISRPIVMFDLFQRKGPTIEESLDQGDRHASVCPPYVSSDHRLSVSTPGRES